MFRIKAISDREGSVVYEIQERFMYIFWFTPKEALSYMDHRTGKRFHIQYRSQNEAENEIAKIVKGRKRASTTIVKIVS